MNGIEVVETVYNKISEVDFPGWMDKKPLGEKPQAFFIVAALSTEFGQALNRVPININVATEKTELGLPKRDILNQMMQEIEAKINELIVDGVYFSAEKTMANLILDDKEYDFLNCRYEIFVTR